MNTSSLTRAFAHNFLGQAPDWYKACIVIFLILNPFVLLLLGSTVAGWIILLEFIFTLAMALKCYPLQPGGLIALEAVALGLAQPETVFYEAKNNFEVILLLMFMVAGIYFMKDLLLFIFTKVLIGVKSKRLLSLLFMFLAAILSAFLDALTVIAVLIAVGIGFYNVYHKVLSSGHQPEHDEIHDEFLQHKDRDNLDTFRLYLSNLMMHGAVGTALGGVCTLVGEPQNLLIAEKAGWEFVEFFVRMAPVSMPVFVAGMITCFLMESGKWFNYGVQLPTEVRSILEDYDEKQKTLRTSQSNAKLIIQALVAIFLVIGLAMHLAAVGLIGLTIIVLLTAFNGVIEEQRLGHAFEEALPFTALLVVFFAIVAVIHEQHLFKPIIDHVLAMDLELQAPMFFLANGVLSMISDNVFVATVYINEAASALNNNIISREQFEKLAIAINTGTNIPSIATPNGQAAFLFLLTSALAPLLRLSYGRMVWMALPYSIVLSIVGFLAVVYFV